MVEVIPSINVRTLEEVKEKVCLVEPHVKWCHLDVTDGVFSSHETWRDPKDLLDLETNLNIEVHLMVSNPDEVIDEWLIPLVKRVIVHTEAIQNFDLVREKCRDRGIELGVAVNPETAVEAFEPYVGKADVFLFLAVPPGPSGNPMHPNTVGKIASFRKSCPECIIEVDGGVNAETGSAAVKAGANFLATGKYIFDSPDIQSAIISLQSSE